MTRLFVYGSLMKKATSHEVIKGCKFITAATLKDYCLYDLGVEMAAIVPCPSNSRGVYGEVYEVSADKLDDIDNFTGYVEGSPEDSLFERVTVNVETVKKETLEVDTYVLPESRLSLFMAELISQGRWV